MDTEERRPNESVPSQGDPAKAVEKSLPDRTEPQGEDRRINRKPLPVSARPVFAADDRFAQPDNFDNAGRDPQQIMDDNLSQYVTGQPN